MKVVESKVENKKRDLQAVNNEYSQCAGFLGDRLFKQYLFEQEIIGLKEKMTLLNKEAAKIHDATKKAAAVNPEVETNGLTHAQTFQDAPESTNDIA